MACPENSTLEVCDLLEETGEGISIFIEAIRSPLGKFILFLAIIGGIVALILGIVYLIRRLATKHYGK